MKWGLPVEDDSIFKCLVLYVFRTVHLKIKVSYFSSEAKKHQGSLKDAILIHSSQMQWVGKECTSSDAHYAQFLMKLEPCPGLSHSITP